MNSSAIIKEAIIIFNAMMDRLELHLDHLPGICETYPVRAAEHTFPLCTHQTFSRTDDIFESKVNFRDGRLKYM